MVSLGKMVAGAALVALALLMNVGASQAGNAPLGYQLFCLQNPAECRGGGKNIVDADADVMLTLRRINTSINRAIQPVADGDVDVWTANARTGDCEDYVLAKRRALIRAGISASALRIAHVKTRDGQDHAILVVNTRSGKYVLDNLTNSIRLLSQTRYRVMSMQGGNPQNWS
jgi:predicted transglutaminase-like cysteine proteinase